MEKQLVWIRCKLDLPAAVPAWRIFDWPSRENRSSLTLQYETNKDPGSREATQKRSPLQTHNNGYWQVAVVQQEGEQYKHTAWGSLLCHSHSLSDFWVLVQESIQLGITYEVSGDNKWGGGFYQEQADSRLKQKFKCKPFSAQKEHWIQATGSVDHGPMVSIQVSMALNRKHNPITRGQRGQRAQEIEQKIKDARKENTCKGRGHIVVQIEENYWCGIIPWEVI